MTTTIPNSHGNITGASPNNHGKKWTTSEDEHITDKPSLPDSYFSKILCRSEQAVQSRRAALAAKLHKSSGLSIKECAEQLYADPGRTEEVVNNNAKRMEQKTTAKPHYTKRTTPPASRASPVPRQPPTAVSVICNHIKRTKGDMDGLWAQDVLVPTLVLFYAGLQAYATFISAEHRRASQRQ